MKVVLRDASGRVVEDRMAPFHKLELDIGDYEVELSRPQFLAQTLKVSVRDDKETRLEPRLQEKGAVLVVESGENASSDVWVDGAYQGKATPVKLELQKGRHTVVSSGFFGDSHGEVDLKPDEKRQVRLEGKDGKARRWAIPLGVGLSVLLLLVAGK